MTLVEISNRQRRTILLAIEKAIPAVERQNWPRSAPRYPDSIPEIEEHIDYLVQLVRLVGHPNESPAARIRDGICDRCPHQFPQRYCPLRHIGRCVPYRCAEQISQAVLSALQEDR